MDADMHADIHELQLFRVIVRGHFSDLSESMRERLLANVSHHDLFRARYTTEGCWSYDPSLVAFNIRFELRGRGPNASREVQTIAESRAQSLLEREGVTYRRIRSTVTNMQDLWNQRDLSA